MKNSKKWRKKISGNSSKAKENKKKKQINAK